MDEKHFRRHTFALAIIALTLITAGVAVAQDYDRYRPLTVPPSPEPLSIRPEPLPNLEGSDRILVEVFDAVIILDHADKVQADDANAELQGLHFDFDTPDSLVYSSGFNRIVEGYLGGPITLRRLNELSRDLIQYYRRCGQPVVDIVIPEQKITGGTVQLVVIESRIASVRLEGGCYFEPCLLTKWSQCTRRGSRIYESAIENDLFWLNQNPFRRVNVDLRPGIADGTTDVIFEINDVKPLNAYVGYEDTGVPALMLERLYTGLIWGNAFGRDATLSYQYTADADFRHLHAHAASYREPLNRCWSFQTYGSWAGVDPVLGGGLNQEGESWQTGIGLIRHLTKNRYRDTSLSFGFDFKTTNNNLEFGGVNVQNSSADLAELRAGYQDLRRYSCDEYSIFSVDAFVGPGPGFSSGATTAAFNTIRPGTSPDFFYTRARLERLWNLGCGWQLVARAKGQLASERLLPSETLGFGGYDSIRGYDQRAFSGDHGWITNLEFGPRTKRWCGYGQQQTLRLYGFYDAGKAFIDDPIPGEINNQFLHSIGMGMRWSIGQRVNLRLDYAHGLEDAPFFAHNDRIHLGLVTLFGPRP